MQAVVFDGALRLAEVSLPTLRPGEALIAPRLMGICATDVQITRGYMGFHGVLGHEFVGTVVACADAAWLGQRVVGEINCCDCGDWAARAQCSQRTTLGIVGRDGAMSEQFALPVANLHRVPDSVPDEAAVFAEPLAAALQIVNQAHIRPNERVAVVGDGKLGLLVAQVLRLTGAEITLVGRHPERWAVVERQGSTATGDAGALPARGWDVVVECTGQATGLETSRRLVRPHGRLVLKSTFAGDVTLNLAPFVVDEITVIGSRCGPFAAALRLLARGLIETAPLLYARYPLAEAEAAFAAAHGQLKVVMHTK